MPGTEVTKVCRWVRDLVEEVWPVPFQIGDTVQHPDGRSVRIIDGQFWGTHGVSNFWYWREVLGDGSLSSVMEHGYGWQPGTPRVSFRLPPSGVPR